MKQNKTCGNVKKTVTNEKKVDVSTVVLRAAMRAARLGARRKAEICDTSLIAGLFINVEDANPLSYDPYLDDVACFLSIDNNRWVERGQKFGGVIKTILTECLKMIFTRLTPNKKNTILVFTFSHSNKH